MVGREQVKRIRHVQLVAALGVFGDAGQAVVVADFADHGAAGVAVQQGAQLFQKPEVLGSAFVVHMVLAAVGVDRVDRGVVGVGLAAPRVVAQRLVMEIKIRGVEPVAVHSKLQPEAHIVEHGGAHLRVVEIQVGLRDQKVVHVVLQAPGVPLPGAAAKDGQPVVGRRAVVARVSPHIPVCARVVLAGAALDEPRVLIGCVREHLVDHDFQAQAVRVAHQFAKVIERAEERVDVAVIADVVTEVFHRTFEYRRQPHCVSTKRCDMGQALRDAGQIAHAVAVAVLEGARVDLVDDAAAPPIRCVSPRCGRLIHGYCGSREGPPARRLQL